MRRDNDETIRMRDTRAELGYDDGFMQQLRDRAMAAEQSNLLLDEIDRLNGRPTCVGGKAMTQSASETNLIVIGDIRDAIHALPEADCRTCLELAEDILWMIYKAGSPVGELALALVRAELQAK